MGVRTRFYAFFFSVVLSSDFGGHFVCAQNTIYLFLAALSPHVIRHSAIEFEAKQQAHAKHGNDYTAPFIVSVCCVDHGVIIPCLTAVLIAWIGTGAVKIVLKRKSGCVSFWSHEAEGGGEAYISLPWMVMGRQDTVKDKSSSDTPSSLTRSSTMLSKLLPLISVAVAASAAVVTTVVPPALRGPPSSTANTLSLDGTDTDAGTIANTVAQVNQKSGATDNTPPNQPVPPTVVTAIDGTITDAGQLNSTGSTTDASSSRRDLVFSRDRTIRRDIAGVAGFEQVFAGTGTGPNDRDASIEGTAYLTYTVVPNATYDIASCLNFCAGVQGCVFANLYYEFNNELLDFVFHEQSNLKCALYGDVHTAAEKTNFGGQQLEAPPAGLTFIQNSSGFAADSLVDPADPEGYELVFGPTNGANNAPGYMGFAFLDKYDVDACAQQCNTRGADSNGGACQYFNIWRAVVNGNPTTYTCSMYFIVADASTAVNTGQGDLQVTFSRGYKRKNFLIDGGFEGFQNCDDFCFAASYANWVGTSPKGGVFDATFFFFETFAHSGHGSALLGSADGSDKLSGTITPAKPLDTVAGKTYEISFFQQSSFAGATLEAPAFFTVLWNGEVVQTVNVGFTDWKFFSFQVTAKGNDVFAITGGAAPAWSFFDDINIFQL